MHLARTLRHVTLMFLMAGAAVAADTTRVDRYIELSRMESMMGQLTQMMQAAAEQSLAQVAQQQDMSPEQIAKAREMLFTQLASTAEALNWNAMRPEVAAVIDDTFTDTELDAINAFYASPEGQSILDKQPELMRRSGAIGQRRMMEVMPVMQAELKRIIEAVAEAE
jgi:uncharacterized protein